VASPPHGTGPLPPTPLIDPLAGDGGLDVEALHVPTPGGSRTTLGGRPLEEWANEFDPQPVCQGPFEPIANEELARQLEALQARQKEAQTIEDLIANGRDAQTLMQRISVTSLELLSAASRLVAENVLVPIADAANLARLQEGLKAAIAGGKAATARALAFLRQNGPELRTLERSQVSAEVQRILGDNRRTLKAGLQAVLEADKEESLRIKVREARIAERRQLVEAERRVAEQRGLQEILEAIDQELLVGEERYQTAKVMAAKDRDDYITDGVERGRARGQAVQHNASVEQSRIEGRWTPGIDQRGS
jgi:hypothetical protein